MKGICVCTHRRSKENQYHPYRTSKNLALIQRQLFRTVCFTFASTVNTLYFATRFLRLISGSVCSHDPDRPIFTLDFPLPPLPRSEALALRRSIFIANQRPNQDDWRKPHSPHPRTELRSNKIGAKPSHH